ncbi:MAG: hypothetical protein ACREGB_03645 [Candidatus Saccharimonadales bacterium]
MSINAEKVNKLKGDYVGKLSNIEAELNAIENRKQQLFAGREQLRGAIFSLEQLLAPDPADVAPQAPTKPALRLVQPNEGEAPANIAPVEPAPTDVAPVTESPAVETAQPVVPSGDAPEGK